VHPLSDEVASTLEYHLLVRRKMNSDVGPVDLFLYDERFIRDETGRFPLTKVLIIKRAFGTEKVRRSWVFDEVIV
jgi:hypothetical protein